MNKKKQPAHQKKKQDQGAVLIPSPVLPDEVLPVEKKPENIKLSMHSAYQWIGHPSQRSLFDDEIRGGGEIGGINIPESIKQFGFVFIEEKRMILESILKAFTDTRYLGNIPSITKAEVAKNHKHRVLPDVWKGIDTIPLLRINQRQIIKLCGLENALGFAKARCMKYFKELGTIDNFFYFFERAVYDKNGNPILKKGKLKDGESRYQKEEVKGIGTAFTFVEVSNPETKKVKYYEIYLHGVFLSQLERYFLRLPADWRDEIIKAVGKRKVPSYVFRFIFFLRYEFELQRRKKIKSFKLIRSWIIIAENLQMPESTYKRNKSRANEILLNCYEIAKQVGYLTSYKAEGLMHTLIFNKEKYYSPKPKELPEKE